MGKLRTIDIVFVTTSRTDGEMLVPKPIRTKTQLYQDIQIGLQSNELWKAVFAACRSRGHSFDPVPQFGQLYALWNDNPVDPSEFNWDRDQSLATAVALSRLIHPTSISFESSARVMFGPDSHIKQIIPGPVSGLLAHAYVAPSAIRNWLTDSDVLALCSLLTSFHATSANLPPRVQRALWNHEYAAALQWLDVRWTVVATALESLVHTDYRQSTKQFTDRVPVLANRVGVNFSQKDAKQAYNLRSSLAHGQEFGTGDDTTTALYCRMEEVLRAAIRMAIQDTAFRDIFRSEDQIRAELPLDRFSKQTGCPCS